MRSRCSGQTVTTNLSFPVRVWGMGDGEDAILAGENEAQS